MNLHHIRYALEVNQTGSITKAAENLYMNQPNLSKAIRELEDDLGYKIFNRTTKGITATRKGEIFLLFGKKVLTDVKELEDLFSVEEAPLGVSAVVPKYFPLSHVLNEIINNLEDSKMVSWHIIEMDGDNAIQQILEGQSNLGILRYPSIYDLYVRKHLQNKGLESRLLAHNGKSIVFSSKNNLSKNTVLSQEDLSNYIEIQLHIEQSRFLPEDYNTNKALVNDKIIEKPKFLFSDISTALELLHHNPNTFLYAPSPLPSSTLEHYGLCQLAHWDDSAQYMNRLIYSPKQIFSEMEQGFIKQVLESLREGNATLYYDKTSPK